GPLSPRRAEFVSGLPSLWRHTEANNSLYLRFPEYAVKLCSPDHDYLHACDTAEYICNPDCSTSARPARHPAVEIFDLRRHPHARRWQDGHLYDSYGQEWPYLHFMTWKRYLKRIDFGVEDSPRSFVVQRRGIWSKGLPGREAALNRLGYDVW